MVLSSNYILTQNITPMKKLLLIFATALILLFTGCSYDDTQIWDAIDNLEDLYGKLDERLDKLEDECQKMNTNIEALQTLTSALQNHDTITNIVPIKQGDRVIGYTITFSKSEPITIYHGNDGRDGANGANGQDGKDGKDGQDGYTPIIGVALDSDNIYYWTLDGEWLLDAEGSKIKANGTDGKDGANGDDGKDGQDGQDGADGKDGQDGQDGQDGKDGITPQLKIEDEYWYISYDNGSTWKQLGKATGDNGKDGADGKDGQDGANGANGQDGADGKDGKDGDSFFKDITWDNENIYFTLSNGTIIILPIDGGGIMKCNEIWYTSTDGYIVQPNKTDVFGANIVSNTYTNGKGIITLDGNVTTIGYNAFSNCSNLASITIPNNVTSIGESAFKNCYKLTYINLPDSITSIGNYAFYNCSNLLSINLPNSITSIGEYAFRYCSSLASITIPDSVTSIGSDAFWGCSSLAEFKGKFASEDGRCLVVDGVLNYFAPAGLTEYSIPEGVTSIGNDAFYNCSNLLSINLPNNVTSIGESAFKNCYKLTYINLPDSITSIGNYAFYNCSNLLSINLPNSITSIGIQAFFYCSNLTNITIPNSITSIGNQAFYECINLSKIILPESVTSIGSEALGGCSCVVYCKSTTPPTIDNKIGLEKGYIVVPSASVNAYKQSAWNDLNVVIIGEDEFDEIMYGEGTYAFLKAIVDGNMLGDQTPTITDWSNLSQINFPGITLGMINNKLEIVRIDNTPFVELPKVMNLPFLNYFFILNADLTGKVLPAEWNTPELTYCNFAQCGLTGTIPAGFAETTPKMHTAFINSNYFYGAWPHTWAAGVNGGSGILECFVSANINNKSAGNQNKLPIFQDDKGSENDGMGYMVPATLDVKLNKYNNDDPSQGHANPSRDYTQIKLGGVFTQQYIGFEKGWGQERYVKYGGGTANDTATWNNHRLLIDEWARYLSNMGYTDMCMPIPTVMLDWDQAAADAWTAEAAIIYGTN